MVIKSVGNNSAPQTLRHGFQFQESVAADESKGSSPTMWQVQPGHPGRASGHSYRKQGEAFSQISSDLEQRCTAGSQLWRRSPVVCLEGSP